MSWRRLLLVIGLCQLPLLLGSIEILEYQEKTGKRLETHTYRIETIPDGYRVTLKRTGRGGDLEDVCHMDGSFSTRSWEFSDRSQNTMIVAERTGNRIHLSGTYGDKNIDKIFVIDDLPWKQLFSIDFASFVSGSEEKSGFWSIGTSGVGAMKAAAFSVKRGKEKTIDCNGRAEEAVSLRIALKGWRSILWHGDYWMRRSDGRYLLYEGRNGLFSAKTKKELVSETTENDPGKGELPMTQDHMEK